MFVAFVLSAVSAVILLIALAWLPMRNVTLASLLEQARPAGTLATERAALFAMIEEGSRRGEAFAALGMLASQQGDGHQAGQCSGCTQSGDSQSVAPSPSPNLGK